VEGVGADGGEGRERKDGSIKVGDGRRRGEVGSVKNGEGRQGEVKAASPFSGSVGGLIVDFLLRGSGGGEAALAGAAAITGLDGREGGIIITDGRSHGGQGPSRSRLGTTGG